LPPSAPGPASSRCGRSLRRYSIDAGKIESELGWRPSETFASGLEKTVDWYLTHQDWVAQVAGG
jgi:dTDP-glucose 4,6-dehydratase